MPENPVTYILSTQRNPAPLNIHAPDALHCILECYLRKTLEREHEPASSQSRGSILRAVKRAISSPGRRLQHTTERWKVRSVPNHTINPQDRSRGANLLVDGKESSRTSSRNPNTRRLSARSLKPYHPVLQDGTSVTQLSEARSRRINESLRHRAVAFCAIRQTMIRTRLQTRRLWQVWALLGSILVACGSLSASVGPVFGQDNPDAHSAHHPPAATSEQASPPTNSSTAPAAMPTTPAAPPQANPMGGMGEMMGQMMKQPAKQFYPSLMNMPTLTPEAHQYLEREAQQSLATGAQSIGSGQTELHHAMAQKDAVAIQKAAAGVREGLLQAESGAAALRALSEGQEPRQFALTWFKGQMSLPVKDWMSGDGLWGLSWYHLTMMAFLVAFLLGAVLIHYARLRSISKLVQRLTPTPAGSSAPVAPTASAPPSSSAAPPAPAQAPVVAAATSTPASAPKRPWSGPLRVAAIFEETPNVKTFRFVGTDAGAIPFTFIPGQFLTFSAEVDGKPIRRSYTIASSPTQHHYVEITVKREEQGAESRYLHDHVAIGDRIEVSGPSGVFTFTSTEAASIVLIGGGVGITPLMCIIRYLTDRAFPGDIFFLYAARTPQDFIFREELDYLVKRHRNLHVSATMARAEGTSWTGTVGYISKEFVAHAVPDIARRRVHVCGPPPMMEAVKAQLLELGVARGKIKTEAFGPALGAAPAPAATPGPPALTAVPAPAPAISEGAPTPATPAAATKAAPAIPSAQVEVQFSKSGKTGPLAPDQSVLEAAEAIGVAIDFSCRVGTCGTCVVPLLKGAVTMAVEEGLPPADKARGIILACQAKSAGALVVDA